MEGGRGGRRDQPPLDSFCRSATDSEPRHLNSKSLDHLYFDDIYPSPLATTAGSLRAISATSFQPLPTVPSFNNQ